MFSHLADSGRHVTSVFQSLSLSLSLQGKGRRGPWERGCFLYSINYMQVWQVDPDNINSPTLGFRDMSRNAHNNKNGKNGKISPTTTWRSMQMRRQEGPLVKPAILANLANLAKMANWSKSPTTTWRPMQMRGQEGPLGKPANLVNLAKMANWSKSPTITWRPMHMRRQEGPLVKPANLANLAKMANWSKSPTTTWRPMQMRRQEGPLVEPAILANLANLAKMANWSKSPATTWRPMQMRRQEGPLVKPAILANLAYLAKMANWSKSPTTTWRLTQTRGLEGPLENLANFVAFEIIILQINVTSSLNTTQNSPHIPGANACGRHVNRWNTMYYCWMMLFVHSWQHSLQKRFFEEFVAYKKLHQRSLPGIASFLRKTFTHLRQRAWLASFVSWKLDITACRWPHLPSSQDPTIIRQSLAQSQKTASLRIHSRCRELKSCYSWKLEFIPAHHFEMSIAICAM